MATCLLHLIIMHNNSMKEALLISLFDKYLKRLSHDETAGKWQRWDLIPGNLPPDPGSSPQDSTWMLMGI